MKPNAQIRLSLMISIVLLCAFPAGCKKRAEEPKAESSAPQSSAPQSTVAPQVDSPSPVARVAGDAPEWISNPQVTPGTTVLAAVDPHDMTPSERQFGRAPKLSPDVDYKPGVIVMEEGDKAIKSVSSNGLIWTFDANSPHVSDFQEGRIVFATGRAVGKVTALRRSGNSVSLVLGPVQLTDVIERGRFVMDQPIDPDKIITYIAPDYPGANDSTGATKTSMLNGGHEGEETVVLSTPSHGRWIPTSMSRAFGDGRRATYQRRGERWVAANRSMESGHVGSPGRQRGALGTFDREPQGIPSMPQGRPQVPTLKPLDIPATQSVLLDDGNIVAKPVANKSYLGLQYSYYNKKSGMTAYAGGLITLQSPVVRCVLTFVKGAIDSAGIEIKGAGGVKLRLDSHSPKDQFANMHLKKWVPLDMSIQLGGPVPLSLTFAVLFDISSGFSANLSYMVAEGEYGFSGGIWAGRAGGRWTVGSPIKLTPITNLGQSLAGVSLGINSFDLSFAMRSTVGFGAFGFNAGVFAQVRFGGSLLLAPTEAVACRQATIQSFLDTGLGYQMPSWSTNAINFFLGAVGAHPIDPVGTLVSAPPQGLFHGFDQIPTGCSGKPG